MPKKGKKIITAMKADKSKKKKKTKKSYTPEQDMMAKKMGVELK